MKRILCCLLVLGMLLPAPLAAGVQPGAAQAPPAQTAAGIYRQDLAQAMFDRVNQTRSLYGLPPLVQHLGMAGAAQIRAAESAETFSHTRPDGTSFRTVHADAEGENLVAPFGYSEDRLLAVSMDTLMGSPGHRNKILHQRFKSLAIACYQVYDQYFYVQIYSYVQASSAQDGWGQGQGGWYYFQNGSPLRGWQTLGRQTYYFHPQSGLMQDGWSVIRGKVFYFSPRGAAGKRGAMATGLVKVGRHRYYFKPGGAHGSKGQVLTGWHSIKGKRYYFTLGGKPGQKGRMVRA